MDYPSPDCFKSRLDAAIVITKHKVDFTLNQVTEGNKVVSDMQEVKPDESVSRSPLNKFPFFVNKSIH